MVNKNKVGNERYRGFLPDMLKKLQERLEFQYELYEVEVRVVRCCENSSIYFTFSRIYDHMLMQSEPQHWQRLC